jgi:hypothetical protein
MLENQYGNEDDEVVTSGEFSGAGSEKRCNSMLGMKLVSTLLSMRVSLSAANTMFTGVVSSGMVSSPAGSTAEMHNLDICTLPYVRADI